MAYPVHFSVDYQERASRLTTFFRLLLVIPHVIVLALWAILAWVLSIVAWFAIVITGRYPRAGPVLAADRQHELSAHRPHRAAVGVTAIQRHGDGRLLAGAETCDDISRNFKSGRCLSGEQEGPFESHARQYARLRSIVHRRGGRRSRREGTRQSGR